jgi:ornithine carbamoyltransferase
VELATYASVPVINGLSDAEHPAQTLSDLLTIRDRFGRFQGLKIAYVGDGRNNVTHSLLLACSKLGADIAVASPRELSPEQRFIDLARDNASVSGSRVTTIEHPEEAVRDANVVYTDVWVSMGREAEREERLRLLRPYQINATLMGNAKSDVIFMHCLPQHVGDEVTEDVAYGDRSVIFDQAESRLHAQKALILFLLQGAASDG